MALPTAPAPLPATAPAETAMEGACDTHIHMLAAPSEWPLWDGRVEDPASGLTAEDFLGRYRAQCEALGIARTVVVHSILYGDDNRITLRAVEALGRDTTRAIVLVRDEVDETTLDRLREAGGMGVRLNYVHGGMLSFEGAVALAPKLASRGMHLQMLVHSDRHMAELAPIIRRLPLPVVIDHIGWPPLEAGPSEPGFEALCALVAEGQAYVKLSGIYRFCAAPYAAADAFVSKLVAANPKRCLWGSDFPYIMLKGATTPDAGVLLDAFHRAVPDHATRQTVMVDNPIELYGF